MLYCDLNNIFLQPEQQYFSEKLNQQVVKLGQKNDDLEETMFGSCVKPICFFVDGGNRLDKEGYSYDPDVQKFVEHLEKVKANYKKAH